MPACPEVWTLDRLTADDLGATVVWATDSVADVVTQKFGAPVPITPESLQNADTVIAIGGGTLLDRAKWIARAHPTPLRLIAIPSIWGSGAEASPVVLLREGDSKKIIVDDRYIPDVRVVWAELAATLPAERARVACGDAWAHALEGFLSPLASPPLREELAAVIEEMLTLPIANDARWFDVSARACSAQARSSVGLVHGIAHVLELKAPADAAPVRWGHAGLCSTWLWPVMTFNLAQSDVAAGLLAEYELPLNVIIEKLADLFDAAAFRAQRDVMSAEWRSVLRDPSTRTNVTLVRPASLQFFEEFDDSAARAAAVR
ncbi:MAG TPA: iron-containing alcohol dehydrogenase [Thermoanaerobaculia bacterium]|nr:iron-containing alcohol dehydrogenase [Thermoanaerobaculia bacterium]